MPWTRAARSAGLEARHEIQAQHDALAADLIRERRTLGALGKPGSPTWRRTATTWRAIAEHLTEQHVPTPREAAHGCEQAPLFAHRWTHTQVRRIAVRHNIH